MHIRTLSSAKWQTAVRSARILYIAATLPRYYGQVRSPPVCYEQRRGAKTKVVRKIKDLPQGALGPIKLPAQDDEAPSYPPMLQQHFNNVRKFSDCVVLSRIGNFYELYGEQAEKFGPMLNLKVARRRTAIGPVAMAGFQIFQLDRYLKLLVQDLNQQVAISEEMRNSASDQVKTGGLMYDRKVTRVITAGTLIDETFVDPYENNFLLSVYSESPLVTHDHNRRSMPADLQRSVTERQPMLGLSWVDLSSGDFYTQQTSVKALGSMVARIMPREVLLLSSLEDIDRKELRSILGEGNYTLNHHDSTGAYDRVESWNDLLDRPITVDGSNFSEEEVAAASLLLDYVQSKLQDLKVTLRPPVRRTDEDSMRIDKHTLRGLEIRSTLRDSFFQGSLLHVVRRTVTKSGARSLTRRLVSPSMSLTTINERLDLVEEMLEHHYLRDLVLAMLERTFDTPRLVQKFSLGRGDADDLLGVGKTIDIMERLFERIRQHCVASDISRIRLHPILREIDAIDFDKLRKLSRRIQNSIDEEGLSKQQLAEQDQASELADFAEQVVDSEESGKKVKKPTRKDDPTDDGEIWTMRKNASQTLQRTHRELEDNYQAKFDLAQNLRERLSSNSLVLKWTPQLGHFCHVKGKDCKIEFPGARNLGSSKTTRSFHLAEWTSLGQQIENVKHRIRAEEQRVFASLRDDVISNLVKLRRYSSVLDDLDIACSSASLAEERQLVRPMLNDGITQTIIGGRHPMVDLGLRESGRSFTSNDCTMTDREIIKLITGPNMAGKSTYLRQNALISILAQTGCYVPADYAEIGLVDKIFSRVGSADDLFNNQSTFMVEMVEVAEILNQATRRSFVVMDEVGRGTTPEDGTAVGYACLKFLHDKIGCRTLFATHFHALADMTKDMERLACWCTDVEEEADGSWSYVHKLKRGANKESHALKVARLAGLPEDAVYTAQKTLERLRGERHQVTGKPSRQKYE
ncbi:hypothetical protein K461DRAFT_265380 [Myriangium duriaei CBS 260.36]|uniref:DNA mismatch repair proteins mutS family domain-containing protein n=1 Tax=Myriangium duriaei CBS 260.36 TaxID=1168546 RepID=A0A9P4JBE6_9PEZI|nr:hypothetical protein K461DRAFT_265380 [Myriangium duriaei CBS 260.36]